MKVTFILRIWGVHRLAAGARASLTLGVFLSAVPWGDEREDELGQS